MSIHARHMFPYRQFHYYRQRYSAPANVFTPGIFTIPALSFRIGTFFSYRHSLPYRHSYHTVTLMTSHSGLANCSSIGRCNQPRQVHSAPTTVPRTGKCFQHRQTHTASASAFNHGRLLQPRQAHSTPASTFSTGEVIQPRQADSTTAD